MRRLLLFAFVAALAAWAAGFKLYLTDGSYHLVSEYKIEGDRVKYYSTERGDWEEIPKELVDLKRTESEIKAKDQQRADERRAIEAEDQAEREERRKIARIPEDPGVYYERNGQLETVKIAESKLVTNKKRQILKIMSPLPMVSGKATLELDGPSAPLVVDSRRPEFFMRLSADEAPAIFKLTPGKSDGKPVRIVEKITIAPVVNEKIEEPIVIETFRQQLADRLFKIWPTQDLEPGEYAVVQYTAGQVNLQIWDFSVK